MLPWSVVLVSNRRSGPYASSTATLVSSFVTLAGVAAPVPWVTSGAPSSGAIAALRCLPSRLSPTIPRITCSSAA